MSKASASSPDKPSSPDKQRVRPGLYGRSKGKTLSPKQQGLIQHFLPTLGLPEGEIDPRGLWPDADQIWIEIGLGGGEHFVAQAAANPDQQLIGFEPFQNGMAKTLNTVERLGLRNVSLTMGDARLTLSRFVAGCVDRIFILYPDPWPKRRHWKRRLIQPDFVRELSRLCRVGAEIRFVSDIDHYQQAALWQFLQNPDFTWTAESCADWQAPPEDHTTTKYEQKAFREKRTPAYLHFVKRAV